MAGHSIEESCRVGDRKPGLFLIGSMKSGTTYLRKLLASHPAIFMCEPDEPSYFVDPRQLKVIWRDMWERGFWRSEAHYLRLFLSAGDATILGEASTNYTKLPLVSGVPEKIQAFNPDARFIYLLRDPIQRTISHYWHMVRHHVEHRSIFRAIREDNQYLTVSHYAMQIKPYLERFGNDRVAIVTLESLARQPIEVMRELYEWLGVDMGYADVTGFAQPENVTPEVIRMPLWGGLPRRLRQSPPFRNIFAAIPQPIQTVLRHFASRDVRRYSVDLADTVAYLRPIQRRQTEELAGMIGREFPEWTTLMEAAAEPSPIPDPGVIGTSNG
jgi:hypothetical protein